MKKMSRCIVRSACLLVALGFGMVGHANDEFEAAIRLTGPVLCPHETVTGLGLVFFFGAEPQTGAASANFGCHGEQPYTQNDRALCQVIKDIVAAKGTATLSLWQSDLAWNDTDLVIKSISFKGQSKSSSCPTLERVGGYF